MSKVILTTADELRQVIVESLESVFIERAGKMLGNDSLANGKKYLTITEAAQYLNLAKQTIYSFTSSRSIPFIKRAKRLLFQISELDEWLAQGKKNSRSQIKAGINNPAK